MRQRWNGSVQSSNTPSYDKLGIGREDYAMYRCMILKVVYVDDKTNISKNSPNPEVLYEAVILGGSQAGNKLSNCRLAQYLNYSERTLTPSSKDPAKAKLSDHDGDIVYIQFNQGHDSYPIIVALAKALKDPSGAKAADGPRLLEVYNGLLRNINNKGELTTTMFNGSVKDNRFKQNDASTIKEEWLSNEQRILTFKSGLKITEDGKNDKVEIVTAGGVKATMDGKGDKIELTTSGGAKTEIDGKGSKISIKAGSTEIEIDGNSGKVSIKADMIDLGSAVADFVTQFTQLASAFATHTHPFIDLSPIPVPSMTQPPAAPLLVSVGSQTVKVQP